MFYNKNVLNFQPKFVTTIITVNQLINMDWIITTTKWWAYIFLLGVFFLPLTRKIFSTFSFDQGYSFAKALALMCLSYLLLIFGLVKILPFTQTSILLLITVSFFINYFLLKPKAKNKLPYQVIIFEEALFIVSLFFWTFVRGQEPSIRGLEKFMDFGFINSILRADYFPPLDMWYAKLPINYYYFGHLTGATLIKLTETLPAIGYNLILSTIFAMGVTQAFSLVVNIIVLSDKQKINALVARGKLIFFGLLGAFLLNLGGNLHTIYLFTKGYNTDSPQPFWQILSHYNPVSYWYPNATRFIPFTIHEFPSYSYVVADLHGHVFDIPFVLLTLAVIFIIFRRLIDKPAPSLKKLLFFDLIFLGFLTAVHYMTNAFDGPIYILFSIIIFFVIYGFSLRFFISALILLGAFWVFSLPFSLNFAPFVSGIGVNCSLDFLTRIGKFGPFIFEKNNCQISPFWMLFVLWGFFWISFLILLVVKKFSHKKTDLFIVLLFFFGILLTLIPEFFYIKDIYPQHFRANTMFKLGYQAFIMMMLAATYVLYQIKNIKRPAIKIPIMFFVSICLFLIIIYPFFSIPSYYGQLNRPVNLKGDDWLNVQFQEDKEIIDYLNKNITGQPVILEAQGDSYTDYERISAYTGLPTVAGWWVHEWLWRGTVEVVGNRIPDIVKIYESSDIGETSTLLKKYQIQYVIISKMEEEKYKNLNQEKFEQIGKKIFTSSNGFGALYQVSN